MVTQEQRLASDGWAVCLIETWIQLPSVDTELYTTLCTEMKFDQSGRASIVIAPKPWRLCASAQAWAHDNRNECSKVKSVTPGCLEWLQHASLPDGACAVEGSLRACGPVNMVAYNSCKYRDINPATAMPIVFGSRTCSFKDTSHLVPDQRCPFSGLSVIRLRTLASAHKAIPPGPDNVVEPSNQTPVLALIVPQFVAPTCPSPARGGGVRPHHWRDRRPLTLPYFAGRKRYVGSACRTLKSALLSSRSIQGGLTSLRHFNSHSSHSSLWNTCPQGSILTISPRWNESMQIAHSSLEKYFLPAVVWDKPDFVRCFLRDPLACAVAGADNSGTESASTGGGVAT